MILSYQYKNLHCEDKTIFWLSYLHNGISYTDKIISVYWDRALKAKNGTTAKWLEFQLPMKNLQWYGSWICQGPGSKIHVKFNSMLVNKDFLAWLCYQENIVLKTHVS